jgi:4'-phosphopantetheinyl transferase
MQARWFYHKVYSDFTWLPECPEMKLRDSEVHLWLASLHLEASRVDALRLILSKNEIRKAAQFRFKEDCNQFIVARGMLRTILGHYISVPPEELDFLYGSRGKPTLASQFSKEKVQFNMSHSHNLALYIITRNRQVGVDLEFVQTIPEVNQLVKRFFCTQEQAAFRALSPEERQEAFFRYWTCKEAYIKARGEGFALAPDQFGVSISPGNPTKLLVRSENPNEVSRWSFCELQPAPGYIAAFAVEGGDWLLSCWQWTE